MIVLDASFLIAFYNFDDSQHAKAFPLMQRFLNGEWGKGLLLEYVFLEVVTVLLVRAGLATAKAAAQLLLGSEELEVVPGSDFFAETVKTFVGQKKTKLSFTDSAIVAVARKRSDGLVLTFDEEFRKVSTLRMAN